MPNPCTCAVARHLYGDEYRVAWERFPGSTGYLILKCGLRPHRKPRNRWCLQAWQHQQHPPQQQHQQQQMQSAASGGMQYPMHVPPQPQQLYSGYGQYAASMNYPPQNMHGGEYAGNGQPQAAPQHQQQRPPPPPQYQPQQSALQQPPPYGVPAQTFPQYGAGPPPPMPLYLTPGGPLYAPYTGSSQPGSDLVMGYPQGGATGYAGSYPGVAPVPPPQPMGAPPPYRPIGSSQVPGSQAQQPGLSPPPVPVKRPITIQAPPGSEIDSHAGAAPSGAVPVSNGQPMGGGRRYSAMTGNLQ